MKISNSSAQQIVEEIGKLVRQNINLMDETGHIIASNDHSRIGDFHQGAYQIVTQQLKELYITPELERTMPKVRQGVNLPIVVDGEVEAVIGITGIYDEVIHYGHIVQKMAEILIRERIAMDAQRLDTRVRSRFLEDWILGDGLTNPQSLAERGYALGINIRTPRRCVVVSVRNPERYTNTLEGQELIERLENEVSDTLSRVQTCIILRNAARQILLLNMQSTQELESLCARLAQTVRARLGVDLTAGIDGDAPDLRTAYLQANRAWRIASHSSSGIVSYADLNAELVLDDISGARKAEYLRKIFPDCSHGELKEYMNLLDAWFTAEGSLTAAAEQLFIHKNTMQYRLKRLAEVTGLDVRKPSNAPALYLAMLFFADLETTVGHMTI